MGKRVLMVGWHPEAVDYDKWPGLTAEKLRAGLEADRKRLEDDGLMAEIAFVRTSDGAGDQLTQTLQEGDFAVVMIGAGVRRDEDHFLLFEELVNVIHTHAPATRIAFNTGPTDSLAAVRRWL